MRLLAEGRVRTDECGRDLTTVTYGKDGEFERIGGDDIIDGFARMSATRQTYSLAFHTLRVQSPPTSCMKPRRGGTATDNTVLVVDEDPQAAAVIAQALRRKGFDVALSSSSATAFKTACDVHPSAMVIDLDARADGALPLLQTLAGDARTQAIPVIVAHCEQESTRAQAQRIGNVVVLLGDCSPETVATEVGRVLLDSADASAPQLELQFPVACPQCKEKAGVPRSVSTAGNGGTYISLACEKCAQQWRVFRRADAPGLKL